MKLVAVLGNIRSGSYTSRALTVVTRHAAQLDGVTMDVVDPARMELPWTGRTSADVERMRELIGEADGIILAVPEYHGSFSAVMKLLIENMGFPSCLAGKPVALMGVAAGGIGAIKSLEQLRGVCSHVGALVLPSPVSIPRVRTVFDDEGRCTDPKVEQRLHRLVDTLVDYIRRLACRPESLEAMVREE